MRIHFGTYVISLLLIQSGKLTATTTYDDVAVIVNINSTRSLAIGNYFKAARSIPEVNIIYVSTDTTEEIDSSMFSTLRSQIENHLTTNNLVDALNYIVTTKGVPLKVNRGNTYSTSSPSSSVESDLACMLGSYESFVGSEGRVTSPYYYQSANFTRAQFGFYLVTRLDGYTVQQVYDIIDRSGPEISVSPSTSFVFDQDPGWNSLLPSLNNYMATARTILEGKGKTVQLDEDTTYQTGVKDVIGYVSWGSNDHYADNYTQYGIPHNTWAPGAIAETYVSTSGRSFEMPPSYGQSLVADLIDEGISGVKGYVYEPFTSSLVLVHILFDRYTSGYNLAESYYMASRYLSWMDVIIGDPKTSIDGPPGPLPVQLHYLNALYNSSSQSVDITWGTISEVNNYGFYTQWRDTTLPGTAFIDIPNSFVPGNGTTVIPQDYSWTHSNVPEGVFYYRLRQIDLDGTTHFTDAHLVSVDITTNVQEKSTPTRMDLAQNYPNPFNPSTTIRFSLARSSSITLKVFNMLGEEVATLVDDAKQPGEYRTIWNANGMASGTYSIAWPCCRWRQETSSYELWSREILRPAQADLRLTLWRLEK
ncbi:MAG: TIGR03790 family protein [Ignavibacteria bacterium]|nr:TIGR03790 family protein [Ignavibacteria bacterium]